MSILYNQSYELRIDVWLVWTDWHQYPVDCLTQLICIGISLCQHTNRKDVAGKSANHYLDCLLDPHLLTLRCLRSLRWSHSFFNLILILWFSSSIVFSLLLSLIGKAVTFKIYKILEILQTVFDPPPYVVSTCLFFWQFSFLFSAGGLTVNCQGTHPAPDS